MTTPNAATKSEPDANRIVGRVFLAILVIPLFLVSGLFYEMATGKAAPWASKRAAPVQATAAPVSEARSAEYIMGLAMGRTLRAEKAPRWDEEALKNFSVGRFPGDSKAQLDFRTGYRDGHLIGL